MTILGSLAVCSMLTSVSLAHVRQDAPPPAVADAVKSLQAIFMDVAGKVRWRPSADAEWRDARMNDIVDAGSEVRTGLRSRATLRVGRNATVLVDSGTTFEVPEVVEDGAQLRTTASVRTGRVDFKVDKIDGFANDFKVVTPQTTLAVRGTGFSLATGPLQGFEVTGARSNMMNAIELKYVAQNLTYFVSGEGRSTSERQDPVQNAWVSTVGPPPVVGALVNNQQLVQQAAQGTAGNAPTNPQQVQQIAAAEAYGEAGGAIVVAANEPGASESLVNLAVDSTGQPDLFGDSSGGGGSGDNDGGDTGGGGSGGDTGGGGSGGDTGGDGSGGDTGGDGGDGDLPPGWESNLPEQLLSALLMVRDEVPDLLVDAQTAIDHADELRIVSGTLAHDASTPALASALENLHGGGTEAMALIGESIRAGGVDRFGNVEVQGRGMDGQLWGRIQNLEAGDRPDVFTTRPTDSVPQQGRLGAVEALENAQVWSTQHSEQSSRDLLALQTVSTVTTEAARQEIGDRLGSIFAVGLLWSIDMGSGRQGEPGQAFELSATQLALDLNEHIQGMWEGVVREVLTQPGGNLSDLAGTQQELAMAISALRFQLSQNIFSTMPMEADNFGRAFASQAQQANTPESRKAAAEVAVLVQEARAEALRTLDAAQQAFAEAGAARTLGHRVFAQSAGNAMVRRAAHWAERSQVATDSIMANAWAMQENFRSGFNTAAAVGALPAVFDTGLNPGNNGVVFGPGAGHGGGNNE
jgi:hypothetical protein